MGLGLATVAGAVVVLWTAVSPVIYREDDNSCATLALSWMIMEKTGLTLTTFFFMRISSRWAANILSLREVWAFLQH